jgi:alkanesulfonate monooxygenase SsuD/methylene tetrahydromethanopterin reductase-like flavin-dependent oxidoreductase (luciferase family)
MADVFGPGTVSVGLSAIGESGVGIVDRLVADALAAQRSGFDGVTLSEHHNGFPHYVPSPMLLAAVLLGRLETGWACAGPAILPLRNPVTLSEDLAWLNAAHPGRVGAGFVPGYQRDDFTVVGADFDTRHATFWAGLDDVMAALGPDSALKADPAIAAAPGAIPVLAGIGGPLGAKRAAHAGAGILITGLRPPREAAQLIEIYREAGGVGPAVLIRRVHLGSGATGFGPSMADWSSRSDSGANWLTADDGAFVAGSAQAVIDGLASAIQESGCTALNLRPDVYMHDPARVSDQLADLGETVLPAIREAFGRG